MDKVAYTPATADAVLRFQQERIIKTLFKEYLLLLEDLCAAHDEALDKLVAALPPEYHSYVNLADYLTPERGQLIRKRVLDRGNDALRNLDEVVEHFNISIR